MNILLDTHCWLWWIACPEKLSNSARQLIEKGSNNIYLSSASSWEIAIKYTIGKLQLPDLPERFIPPRLARDKIASLPVNHYHALHVANLPMHHRDPFDRLLIAQTNVENVSLMTVDKQFEYYDVDIIWGHTEQ